MVDITDSLPSSHNVPEYSVSEIARDLRRTVEAKYDHIRVKGEISGFKRHTSGHLYFALKDQDAVLDAVCWKGSAARLAVRPEDGLEVIASGKLTTYPGRSKYQMVVERLEVAGKGALLALLEERKRKLAEEGLFDPARKKKIPFLPNVIGIVTSPTGAVIQDILHRLADRFPSHVLLWPVAVQGDGAAEQVAAAIDGFNALAIGGDVPRPDLLIVARGGGSLEDLWAFNEEIVVRAAARSVIPLISAVGHETDTTLIDFASDLRAPTPTGAAEKAVPVRRDLMLQIADLGRRASASASRILDERRLRLSGLLRGLVDPKSRLNDMRQTLDDRSERLANVLPNYLQKKRALLDASAQRLEIARVKLVGSERNRIDLLRHRLKESGVRLEGAKGKIVETRRESLVRLEQLLETLSYNGVLKRGFALVRDEKGNIVTDGSTARHGERWQVTFAENSTSVMVADSRTPPRPHAPEKTDRRQGNLL